MSIPLTEIERLQAVIENNDIIAARATATATAALAQIRAAVQATHPSFEVAQGLLDSVIMAVLGSTNEDNPAVTFIHARGTIEQAHAEASKGRALLAAQESDDPEDVEDRIAVIISEPVSDEGSIVIFRATRAWPATDEDTLLIAVDHRMAQNILDAVVAGETVSASVEPWQIVGGS